MLKRLILKNQIQVHVVRTGYIQNKLYAISIQLLELYKPGVMIPLEMELKHKHS